MKDGFRIDVQDLVAGYRASGEQTVVLKEISFCVSPGQALAVLGANGSGKSTLLNCIAGLVKPISGQAAVLPLESAPEGTPPSTIAYLHQDYRQTNYPWATVLSNVLYPHPKLDRRAGRQGALELLNEILPGVARSKRAYELSGGQQQLLALVRALCARPVALLADEPFAALDAIRRIRAVTVLERERQKHGFPVVWISHDIDEALMVGDRIGLLHTGADLSLEIINNPIPRPRSHKELNTPVASELRARILDFLDASTKR